MQRHERGSRHKSLGYLTVQGIGLGVMRSISRPTWEGLEHVPHGPALIVSNHISHADPVTLGHALVEAGHVPRYMAKNELFEVPVLGGLLRSAGQIPVMRVPGKADAAYQAAVSALRAGEQVVLYPEGTVTRDPDGWPMRGKTGAARLALETQVPVIPVGQWGAHEVWRPNARFPTLRLTPVRLRFGPPVSLDDLREAPLSTDVLRQATERIMDAITSLVAQVREATPPEQRWDPRHHKQSETGRF